MSATISHYPRVSEWIYIGQTAINLAAVVSIEFDGDDRALLRLASAEYQYETRDTGLVRYLRSYVDQMAAPGWSRS